MLIALSPTAATRLGSAVYVASCGAAVHGLRDLPPGPLVAARAAGCSGALDHANIFLLIAGTYTPFCLLLLRGTDRVVMLDA